ncbi:ornithine cyclodeaminase family protein [Pseudorhodobacter sp.]|uniref:ornithine cyclodeaminase family protein n=1 Tax=Pseudorhodobacter sp. TaxID=1934400 RepID=UPI0026480672|nr:ornithine cyclodeaminase [Pseudorhodobacter sp.]MDN5786677.1 ornithine cyclodeaminase [Pseudorhodobacter sp.]
MTMEIVPFEADELLNWQSLTDALEAGHRLPAAEVGDSLLYRDNDTLLNRAAWIDGLGQLVKCATIFPGNGAHGKPTINGSVTLYTDKTGELEGLIDFHLVTKWKTAGDSLLSCKKLARKDSRKVLLVGTGAVAHSMIPAYASLLENPEFSVWGRNPVTARAFADATGATAVTDLEAAVRGADIICTATMSKEPLILGEWLQPGQHLDLIGAYRPDMREVDDEAMSRARIFVDARATTVHHIGELMMPIASGAINEGNISADFYDMAKGGFTRRSDDEITIAKNGGGAHLDLMTAAYILQTWKAR